MMTRVCTPHRPWCSFITDKIHCCRAKDATDTTLQRARNYFSLYFVKH